MVWVRQPCIVKAGYCTANPNPNPCSGPNDVLLRSICEFNLKAVELAVLDTSEDEGS